jgi:hypothetical protein
VKATEIIEELERGVHEFGDGEVHIPDPIEQWWYAVSRVEFDHSTQTFRVISDQ